MLALIPKTTQFCGKRIPRQKKAESEARVFLEKSESMEYAKFPI